MELHKQQIDKPRVAKAVRELLIAIGENPDREGLKDTPKRVSNFYVEALSGQSQKAEEVLSIYYEEEQYDEIVLIKNIPFYSLCEHHLLPFYGKIHIAYIPHKKRLLGISKLARLVEMYSRRLQLQERITKHIADTLVKLAKPLGVLVIAEAEHLCFSMRGVKKPGTTIVTSAVRGTFLKDAKTRAEALSLIKK
ncbi:MAG: GTP cyclohydrolase I FolE [Elusimicrobia bacterium]|nr:GTP cyclohydrolase I FolE [Elusimicrobiota bacterium]